jgi:hypothetical protein
MAYVAMFDYSSMMAAGPYTSTYWRKPGILDYNNPGEPTGSSGQYSWISLEYEVPQGVVYSFYGQTTSGLGDMVASPVIPYVIWGDNVPKRSATEVPLSGTWLNGHSALYPVELVPQLTDLNAALVAKGLKEFLYAETGTWRKIFKGEKLYLVKDGHAVIGTIGDVYRNGMLFSSGTGEDKLTSDVIAEFGGTVEQGFEFESNGFTWKPRMMSKEDFLGTYAGMFFNRRTDVPIKFGSVALPGVTDIVTSEQDPSVSMSFKSQNWPTDGYATITTDQTIPLFFIFEVVPKTV